MELSHLWVYTCIRIHPTSFSNSHKQTMMCEIYGCFGMTELGHGSFLRGLETTAHFDTATQVRVFVCVCLQAIVLLCLMRCGVLQAGDVALCVYIPLSFGGVSRWMPWCWCLRGLETTAHFDASTQVGIPCVVEAFIQACVVSIRRVVLMRCKHAGMHAYMSMQRSCWLY